MGLYKLLDGIDSELQFQGYERLILDVKKCIEAYSGITEEGNIEQKINFCIENGSEGLKYYFKEMFDKDDYLKSFSEKVEELSSHIKFVKSQKDKIQVVLSRMGEDINKDIYLALEEISTSYDKNKEEFNSNEDVKSALFMMFYNKMPQYYEVFKKIKPELDERVRNGEKIFPVLCDMFRKKQMDIDLTCVMDYFKYINNSKKKMEKQLNTLIPKYSKENTLLHQSKILKEAISSRINQGEDKEEVLKHYLKEALGLASLAYHEATGLMPRDIQLIGAMSLNDGNVTQIQTGEGKTLIFFLSAYLKALTGDKVDIMTTNDYLAKRDYEKNKRAFELLGFSVGLLQKDDDIQMQKNACECDILYTSPDARAFAILHDKIVENPLDTTNRSCDNLFLDEVDDAFVNLSPYILTNSNKIRTKKEKTENEQVKQYLKISNEVEKWMSSRVYETPLEEEFEYYTQSKNPSKDKNIEDVLSKNNLIVLKSSTGDSKIYLTELGERNLFCYAMIDTIVELSTKHKSFIEECEDYERGIDYTLSPGGKFSLTPEGLDKAINDKRMQEFKDVYDYWMGTEEGLSLRKHIMNAITARHAFTKGKDYEVRTNSTTGDDEIVVLKDGRVQENSRFTDGLHEALELKEGILTSLDPSVNIVGMEDASMSSRALISGYKFVAGASGTTDKTLNKSVFEKLTLTLPSHAEYSYHCDPEHNSKPRGVVKHPTELYFEHSDKIKAIVNEIKDSNVSGQPVLVVSNNEEEAKEIYEVISSLGYGSANLLVSGRTLEEESKIISKAGKKGAITIATEMAGRGTDIVLDDDKSITIEDVLLRESALNWLKKNRPAIYSSRTEEDVLNTIKAMKANRGDAKFISSIKEVSDMYHTNSRYKKVLDEMVIEGNSKGLKVIQAEPFQTERNDNQVIGRTSRGGASGEYKCFSTFDDLMKIGADPKLLKKILKCGENEVKITDNEVYGKITEVIEDAQSQNEAILESTLRNSDAIEFAVNSITGSILKDKEKVIQTDDLTFALENMVISTTDTLLKDNTPLKKKRKINKPSARLTRLRIDYEQLSVDIYNTFGVNVTKDDILSQCVNVSDIKSFIKDKIYYKFDADTKGIPKNKVNDSIRKVMFENLSETYRVFSSSVVNVMHQLSNDYLAQNFQHNRATELNELYNSCKKDCWKSCMKQVFRPGVKEKTDSRTR